VHIGFQRSGGRGEYEVVGSHSGYNAISLEGWTFNLRWPDGLVRETGLGLEPAQSGKPRLRSLLDPPFQIGRMVAAMCMLPDPRRAFGEVGRNLPRVVRQGYVLTRLGFGPDTEFTPVIDMVTIDPSFIDLEDAGDVLSIGIESRWARVKRIYDNIDDLPQGVRAAVQQHRDYMASGDTVRADLVTAVRGIDGSLTFTTAGHTSGDDPVPALERLLGLAPMEGPTLPAPDTLGEDEPEVSARAAVEYRMAKMRGAAARQFSLDVRAAYRHSCAFCGLQLGGVPGVRSGVDAAHILAWSKHDLDVVPNGLSLCKLHHWAFDAALVMPGAEAGGSYRLYLTELATPFPADARARIVPVSGMAIPDAWLPADAAQRPSKTYLERLYADLAVTFAA
jgi:hypothetical protein